MVHVKALKIVRSRGAAKSIAITQGEVDLCALSRDFFGVLQDRLSPDWGDRDAFVRAEIILDEKTGTNRVEDESGSVICSLRVPPGPSAGIRLEPMGRSALPAAVKNLVGFDFDDDDAEHMIGTGDCQLKNPIGHYDLFQIER